MWEKWRAWIRSWWEKKPPAPEPEVYRYDLYHPQDRLIYSYWDGKEERRVDPMSVYKKMMEVGQEISTARKVARSPSKDARKMHDRMIELIRGVFDVTPYEEGGLSETETTDLLDHYLIYLEWVKKNSGMSTTTPEETSPSTPSPTSASEEDPTFSNTSDSGSSDDGPKTEPPGPSDKEPQSASV